MIDSEESLTQSHNGITSTGSLLLNYFPNDSSKHIDYVLFYHQDSTKRSNETLTKLREEFLIKLAEEGFEFYELVKQGESSLSSVYILLYCQLHRLMEEAERVSLEVSLKEDYLNEESNDVRPSNSQCYNRLLKYLKAPRDSQRKKPVSAPFQVEIKYLFEGFEKDTNRSKGFSPTIRSLLVDSILRNFNLSEETSITALFISKIAQQNDKSPLKRLPEVTRHMLNAKSDPQKSLFNLPYMLERGVFEDALILHKNELDLPDDRVPSRYQLDNKWASIKNVLKFQPLFDVRNYFGEYVSLYFAWLGCLVASLWLPSIVGLGFFIAGIIISVIDSKATSKMPLGNNSSSIYGDYYLNLFADSFDNILTPCFAVVICLWGAIFSEYWKQQNSRLAYEWDTENFERRETHRPEYDMKLEKLKLNDYPIYRRYLKYLLSFSILIFMIGFVALDIAAVVIFRIYVKTKVFPNDSLGKVLVGDVGSTILNTILIMALNRIYNVVAQKLTEWENHRTQTEFEDALILKLFAFEFVNSYGSLFYIAFFRTIKYENGLFDLGAEYQDRCDNENCMALLTIQVLVVLLIKPFPRLITTVVYPLAKKLVKKFLYNFNVKSLKLKKRETTSKWYDFVSQERKKPNFEGNIRDEYMEKIILYGYIMLFACSFSLGPLIFLMINLIDLRVDAKRFLFLFRRPIGKKAEDIGIFFGIFRFVNIIGIISNGFLIAYTSNWSSTYFGSDQLERLKFVIAFEHVIFFVWIGIVVIVPNIPSSIVLKMKREDFKAKELILTARYFNDKSNREDAQVLRRFTKTYQGFSNLLSNNESRQASDSASSERLLPFINTEKQAIKKRKQLSKKMMSLEHKIHPSSDTCKI